MLDAAFHGAATDLYRWTGSGFHCGRFASSRDGFNHARLDGRSGSGSGPPSRLRRYGAIVESGFRDGTAAEGEYQEVPGREYAAHDTSLMSADLREYQAPGPPSLMSEWIVSPAGGGDFYVYPDGNSTVVQRVATGERHVIDNGGRTVSVSPDGQRLLWQVIDRRGDFDQRRSQTWVANVDGSQARVVGETAGLGESQWIDAQRILLVGVPLQDRPAVAIAALDLGTIEGDDSPLELAQVTLGRGREPDAGRTG